MNSPRHSLFKKIAIAGLILFFVFELLNPVFWFKHEAVAYADTESGEGMIFSHDISLEIKTTTKETTKEVKETVLERLTKGLILSASIALRNAMVYMSQKLAEQAVNWMATGEWGQGAMFYEQAWNKFSGDIMNYTVGTFLDNLRGTVWDKLGFDICEPSMPDIKIKIMLGIELPNVQDPGMIEQKKPDCSLSKFVNNWEAFGDNVYSKYKQFEDKPGAMSLAFLQDATDVSFDIKYTDMGQYLKLDDEVKKKQEEEKAAQEKQRAEGDGQKPKTSMTGDVIKTPAYAGKTRTEKEITDAKDMQKSEMDSSKEVLTEIPESMVAAFLNSFISKAFSELIINKLFNKGTTSNPEAYKPHAGIYENKEQIAKEVQQAVQVQKVSFSASTKEIDLLTQFTSCPQDRQIFNCVCDGDFAQAVRAAEQDKPLSLREAIESGKVSGGLPFISGVDGRNQDSKCYELGWCYSNLVKLRKARIIPIGWEIAANKIEEGETVTLKDAMDKFDEGNAVTNRFYHLVDPNWILRAPKARCDAEVFGPTLIGSGSDKRAKTCADLKTCLSQDETGKCKAWGYCAAEQNLFRFGGAECPGQFDSCKLLKKVVGGAKASFLTNTLDKTGCDPNSAGCKQYSIHRDVANPDSWIISSQAGEAQEDSLFLNKKVKDLECKPENEGCSRFVRTAAGLGTSYLGNGGFEFFDGQITFDPVKDNVVKGWSATTSFVPPAPLEVVSDAFAGNAAILMSANDDIYTQDLNILVAKAYTKYYAISAKAKKKAEAANISFLLEPDFAAATQITNLANGNKDLTDAAVDNWETVYQIVQIQPVAGIPLSGGGVRLRISVTGGDVVVDNVVLEEIDSPSASGMHEYSDYATKNALYLKKAPTYFNCYDATNIYGRPDTDEQITIDNDVAATDKVKGCAGFAKLCTASDVGCEAYTNTKSGEVMNGVVSFSDYCPQECNGYSTFRQDKSFLDTGFFPVYFIPTTATQCKAEAVGCEEFTNMEDLAQGKESKTYFSELRMCAPLPEKKDQCANFYTWEAKESSGYQLQAYYLFDENDDGIPDTSDQPDTLTCNKEIFEAQINPNCRAFYNDAGTVYYREYSKTITCSADCHPYRRTLKYVAYDENNDDVVETQEQRCTAKKGNWLNNECIFMTIPAESKVCAAEMAGCKAYKGNQAGDEQIMFNATFAPGELDEKFDLTGGFTGKSHQETLPEGTVVATKALKIKETSLSLGEGEYLLSFWLRKKNVGDADPFAVQLALSSDLAHPKVEQTVNLPAGTSWSLYSYNFSITADQAFQPLSVQIIGDGGGAAQDKYVDNLQIKKVTDVQYVIKDSWKTPESCDKDLFDAPLAQAQVGCKEYKDRADNIHYLKTFSGLCESSKVGCEALVDTKNSLYPYAKDINEKVPDDVVCSVYYGNPDAGKEFTGVKTVTGSGANKKCSYQQVNAAGVKSNKEVAINVVCAGMFEPVLGYGPGQGFEWDATSNSCYVKTFMDSADSMIYLVNDEKMSCKNTDKGCMAVGLPSYKVDSQNPNNQVFDAWSTNFYRIDPDLFGTLNSPLCPSYALSCDEYKDSSEASYFFKDPRAKVCEWRKGKIPNTDLYVEAWFVRGVEADVLCNNSIDYAVDYFKDGVKQPRKYGTDGYAGWVGSCPSEEDTCTAFADPTDNSQNNGIGRPYYYLNDSRIDKTCTSVSRENGCMMFNDTSNPELTANAELSYAPPGIQQPGVLPDHPNDSNALIKVVRDRTCGAWYDCKSSHWAWDPNLNKYQEVCDKLGVCTSLTKESDTPKCGSFVPQAVAGHGNILSENIVLSTTYQARPISWGSYEYSGYSIPGLAPIALYDAFNISTKKDNPDFRLVNYENNPTIALCTDDSECETFCGGQDTDPKFKEYCRCLSGTCVRGSADKTLKLPLTKASGPGCRAYPEETAPFPAIVSNVQSYNAAKVITYQYKDDTQNQKFLGAEVKPEKDYGCAYSVNTFGGGGITKYFPVEYSSAFAGYGFCQEDESQRCSCDTRPAGLTTDGSNEVIVQTKKTCSSYQCGETVNGKKSLGICMKTSDTDKIQEALGWQGYCMETDKSLTINNTPGQGPCLTWYPTDSLAGLQDIKNIYDDAGYNPEPNQGNFITIAARGGNENWNNDDSADPDGPKGSKTEIDYVKTFGSHVACDYGGGMPIRNYAGCTYHGWGYSDMQKYNEWYVNNSSREIYKNEILGAVIWCDLAHSEHHDWCNDDNSEDWYDSSRAYLPLVGLLPDANIGEGYFIPNSDSLKHYDNESGPVSNLGPDKAHYAANNYVTTQGKMTNYKFYNDNGTENNEAKDSQGNLWKDYTYWQVVWSGDKVASNTANQIGTKDGIIGGRGEAKKVNRYLFGGNDIIGPSNYLWDVYEPETSSQDKKYLAPLFLNTGYYWDGEQCGTVLTKQSNITKCGAGGGGGGGADGNEAAYKKEGGAWEARSCTSANVATDCKGTWKWNDTQNDFVFNPDATDAKCEVVSDPAGSKNVCSNKQCRMNNNVTNGEGEDATISNVDCANEWHCAGSGTIGWCTYSAKTGAATPNVTDNGYFEIEIGCDTSWGDGDPGASNYFGIRLMFNPQGRYMGYWISLCNDSGGSGGQGLEIRFITKEYARNLAKVNDSGNENKAFTDVVYRRALGLGDKGKEMTNTDTTKAGAQTYIDSPLAPAGSAFGQDSLTSSKMLLIPNKYGSDEAIGGNQLLNGVIDNSGYNYGGSPWGCTDETKLCKESTQNKDSAWSKVKTYFAKIFQEWYWDRDTNNTGGYTKVNDGDDISDTETGIVEGTRLGPPMVAAVVPTGKTDKEGNIIYSAIPGKITVSGKSEGMVEGFDGNADINLKFYAWAADNQMPLKNIKVYWGDSPAAGADLPGKFKNHKPRCERKKADGSVEPLKLCQSDAYDNKSTKIGPWADGIYGYACSESWECAKLPKVNNDPVCAGVARERFGDAADVNLTASGLGVVNACDEAYFSFNHLYQCTMDQATKPPAQGGLADCVADTNTTYNTTQPLGCKTTLNDKPVCRFQPRVQVKDNWEWCNGNSNWDVDGKKLISMSDGLYSMDCSDNGFEYFDGYVYVHPAQ